MIRLLYILKNRTPPSQINICGHLGGIMLDSGALPRTGQTDPHSSTFCSLLCTLTPTHVTRLHGPHLLVLRVLLVR